MAEALKPARRPQKLMSAFMLAAAVGVVWGAAASVRNAWLVGVQDRVQRAGARLTFDFQYPREISWMRRALYLIPGGTSFGRPHILDAQATDFGDDDVDVVSEISDVRMIWFWDSKVTDAGLRRLPQLPSLTSLSLPKGSSEAGMECLERCPAAEMLQLAECVISDAVIHRLIALRSLRELDVRWARISPQQLEALQKSRPDIHITQ